MKWPREPFKIVVADPPWRFGDSLPGNGRGASSHYRTMSLGEIRDFMLPINGGPPVADDALLFMWRVSALQEEALHVARAWGFKAKSELVWVKTKGSKKQMGMGRYTRLCHESCIIASRGRGLDLIQDHSVLSVFEAPRERHSQKPDKFFSVVDRLVGDSGPRLELFARQHRPGWFCVGNELEET
jgi:N6-adenosine-specific RNA methylase IME4